LGCLLGTLCKHQPSRHSKVGEIHRKQAENDSNVGQIIQNRGILLAKRQLHGFMLLPVMDTDQGDLHLERLTSAFQITAAASPPNISIMSLNASIRSMTLVQTKREAMDWGYLLPER